MAELELTSAALRVGKLLLAEINYLDEVRGEVEILQSNLNMLAAFVVEAAASWRQDTLLQTALRESRDLAYDCEDVIETYIWQVARHGYDQYEGCQLGSALRRICPLRKAFHGHKIHSQINDLNKRIANLKSDLQSYGVSARVNTISNDQHLTPAPLRRFYTHEREEFVPVGLESQLEELVSRLIDPTDQTVITISGKGGVGKSTLARELYRHPTLREGGYFQAFGWAAASQQLQPDRVLRTLMYSFVLKEDVERRRQIDEDVKADRAHAALYDMMRQVKCLVVIDDIWTLEGWVQLQAAFPRKAGTGSRLVLTTRNELILSSLDPSQVYLYPVHYLDDVNGWKLFEKITLVMQLVHVPHPKPTSYLTLLIYELSI